MQNRIQMLPFFLKYSFRGFLNRKTIQNQQIEHQFKDIQSLLENLPGYVLIKYKDSDDIISDKNWNKIEIDSKEKVLVSCIWVMPWFEEVLHQIHYLEIDASFYALDPYKYCIYHSITNNSSIPIALSFHPEESSELYGLIYENMSMFQLNQNLLYNLEVLSDMHAALKKFCADYNLNLHFCHRHIIGHFSGHSSLGIWAARLLKARTYNEYLKEKEIIQSELNEFIVKRTEIAPIRPEFQKKIDDLIVMLSDPNDPQIDIEKIKGSNYFLPNWANWLRKEKHIGRCTNHCEGAHGNINSMFPSSGKHTVKNGLMKIINYILNYLENRKDTYNLSFQRRFDKFIEKVRQIVCLNSKGYLKCSNQFCNECDEASYNLMIYGIHFPCIHTILYEYSKSRSQFGFNPDEIVSLHFYSYLIGRFRHSNFEYSKFINSLNEIKQIINDFIREYPEKVYVNNIENLLILATSFLKCFCYTLPNALIINPKEQKYNFTKFKYSISNFNFNSKSKIDSNEDVPIEIDDTDFDPLIQPEDTEEIRLIKKTFIETEKEIRKVYPSLSHLANAICLHNYIYHFSKDLVKTNESILGKVAAFKIGCWLMADEQADKDYFMI